jgi:hypothetical protein
MQLLKPILTLLAFASFSTAAPYPPPETTVIAGITVPNTPLVVASLAYARAHVDDMTYNHVIRTWLFGTIIVDKNATLSNTVDREAHAVAAILVRYIPPSLLHELRAEFSDHVWKLIFWNPY